MAYSSKHRTCPILVFFFQGSNPNPSVFQGFKGESISPPPLNHRLPPQPTETFHGFPALVAPRTKFNKVKVGKNKSQTSAQCHVSICIPYKCTKNCFTLEMGFETNLGKSGRVRDVFFFGLAWYSHM